MAISTSFLGVTLGLFDYIADLFKFDDSLLGRTKNDTCYFFTAIIAKPAISLWICGLPLVTLDWRQQFGLQLSPHFASKAVKNSHKQVIKCTGGNFMIGFVMLFGILNIVAQIGANLGWFASFTG